MNPSVSVLIATYCPNLYYLAEQIKSIEAQTYEISEVIILDDCSPHSIYAQIVTLSRQVKIPTRIFRNNTRLGYGDNFISCLKLSRTDIVFLCDQDDYWFPAKVSTVVQCFLDIPTAFVVIHDLVRTDQHLTITAPSMLFAFRKNHVDVNSFIYGSATALRRDFIPLACHKPLALAHDEWIHYLANLFGCRFLLNTSLGFYRRHNLAITESRRLESRSKDRHYQFNSHRWRVKKHSSVVSLNQEITYSNAITKVFSTAASRIFDHSTFQSAQEFHQKSHNLLLSRIQLYAAIDFPSICIIYLRQLFVLFSLRYLTKLSLMRLSKDLVICILASL